MKIALFSGNYNYVREGANQALNRLVDYLERHGDEVRVYSPVSATPAFEPAGTLIAVPSIALPVRSEFRLALGLLDDVRRDLERFAPDIVHVSTPDVLGRRAQGWAIAHGVPVVASLHTRFETYLTYYRLGWLRGIVEGYLGRFYARSDHVLVPTRAMVGEYGEGRGYGEVTLWSRGVERGIFDPARRENAVRQRWGVAKDELVLLFFGRLVLEKGVLAYCDVVRALQQRGVRVRPLVIGAGPASAPFEALGGTIMAGHLDGDALGEAVANADIMINPSVTEAFGNVVLEAMAAGIVVVSADTPSAAGLITNGVTGMLVSPGERDGYVAAIERLIADPDKRAAIGAAARAASGDFSWDAASASVAEAYRAVIARRA